MFIKSSKSNVRKSYIIYITGGYGGYAYPSGGFAGYGGNYITLH